MKLLSKINLAHGLHARRRGGRGLDLEETGLISLDMDGMNDKNIPTERYFPIPPYFIGPKMDRIA